jgi:hypothetical protein
MTKWFSKKADTKPAAKLPSTELSDDLMAQISGGAAKLGCHTRLTFSTLSPVYYASVTKLSAF